MLEENEEVMLITSEGVIIRLRGADISTIGRVSQGVKLMNLDEGVSVVGIAKITEDDIESEEEELAELAEKRQKRLRKTKKSPFLKIQKHKRESKIDMGRKDRFPPCFVSQKEKRQKSRKISYTQMKKEGIIMAEGITYLCPAAARICAMTADREMGL